MFPVLQFGDRSLQTASSYSY